MYFSFLVVEVVFLLFVVFFLVVFFFEGLTGRTDSAAAEEGFSARTVAVVFESDEAEALVVVVVVVVVVVFAPVSVEEDFSPADVELSSIVTIDISKSEGASVLPEVPSLFGLEQLQKQNTNAIISRAVNALFIINCPLLSR